MQLIETIRFNNNTFYNLDLHQKRMNNSRKELFSCTNKINLAEVLSPFAAKITDSKLYKCRVLYDLKINKVEFIPYKKIIIKSLKIIECNDIKYNHKYYNRNKLNQLLLQKGNADDIIIVKNQLVADASFANLLFYNGIQWVTPAFPLLNGTQRASLLQEKKIVIANIRINDLSQFTKVRLVNAMLLFSDEVDVNISNIL